MSKLNLAYHRLGLTAKEKYVSLTGVEPMTFYTHGSEVIEYISRIAQNAATHPGLLRLFSREYLKGH